MAEPIKRPPFYFHTRAAVVGGLRMLLRRVAHNTIEVRTAPTDNLAAPFVLSWSDDINRLWQGIRHSCPADPGGATRAFGIYRGNKLGARLREFLGHHAVRVIDVSGEGGWQSCSDSPVNSYSERRQAVLVIERSQTGTIHGWIHVDIAVRFHSGGWFIVDLPSPIRTDGELKIALDTVGSEAGVGEIYPWVSSDTIARMLE